jgi:uncharacterized protein (TIGR03083 family)
VELSQVSGVFRGEAAELARALDGLPEAQWDLPTRCAPWSVRDLLGHVCVVAWLPGMLAAPPPVHADVSAVDYYRSDGRFAPDSNANRIGLARRRAAEQTSGPALVDDFVRTWRYADQLCRAEPDGRSVRTRHGDAMLLSDFLLTRVIEVAVHGLDLADALGRQPWLTPAAGDAVLDLLLGRDHTPAAREMGWDRPRFLRKVTGREPLTDTEAATVEQLGIRWIALG